MKLTPLLFLRSAALTAAILLFLSSGAKGQTITFTTQPYDPVASVGAGGVAGNPYSYDADATASNGGTVQYSLRYGPDGMTVAQSSGVVSWTPSQEGTYLVQIRAELAGNPSIYATQNWAILITECDHNAIIQGTVLDNNGNPVQKGTVTAQIVGQSRTPLMRVSAPISNGTYQMTVDQGTYALRVEGEGVISEWYQDAYKFSDATYVTTACGSTTTANFSVLKSFPQTNIEMSGRVIDPATASAPVATTTIGLYQIPRAVWMTTDEQWRTRLNAQNISNMAAPKQDASYGLSSMPNNYVYFPYIKFSGSASAGFESTCQYYGYTPNILEAEPIIRDPDPNMPHQFSVAVPDVNFSVSPIDHTSLTMQVMSVKTVNDSDQAVGCYIIAYAVDITSSGIFVNPAKSLSGMDPYVWHDGVAYLYGAHQTSYIYFAIPYDTNYVPGFYKANDTAALTWEEGTIVSPDSLTGLGSANPLLLRLRRKADVPGTSDGRGKVKLSANGTEKGGTSPQGTSDMAGAFVYALDSAGQVVSYTFSNDDGSYLLRNLPTGTSTVHGDKISFRQGILQKITVSGMGEIAKSDVTMMSQDVELSVPGESAIREASASVRPNPASGSVTIRFEGKAGKARLALVATDGREVMGKEVETTMGENRIDLDVGQLPNGVYLGTIEGEGYRATVRVTVAH